MTDFMAAALQLLPQPAILFEWKGHRYVSANAVAHQFCRRETGHECVDAMAALEELDMVRALDAAVLMPHSTFTTRRDFGIAHITRLPARPGRTRPDLMLLTIHDDVTEKVAYLDHQRMLLSLQVNESSEIAVRVMEDSLTMISAALDSQRDLVSIYNQRMGDFLELNRPEPKENPGTP